MGKNKNNAHLKFSEAFNANRYNMILTVLSNMVEYNQNNSHKYLAIMDCIFDMAEVKSSPKRGRDRDALVNAAKELDNAIKAFNLSSEQELELFNVINKFLEPYEDIADAS